MELDRLIEKAKKELSRLTNLPVGGVVGLSRDQGVWLITIEALERKAIPETMDILGLYQIRMTDDGELQGLDRKKLRKRGETEDEG